jgi:hypothetical protein
MSEAGRTDRPAGGAAGDFIERKLHRAWRKERWYYHTRGLSVLLVWVVGLILLDLLVDWLFLARPGMPGGWRLVLLATNLAAVVVVVHHYWLRYLKRFDAVRVALQVERKHPELRSLLVSYIQVGDEAARAQHASPALVAAFKRQAIEIARPMDFREIVTFKQLERLLAFSAGVLLFFAAVSAYRSDFFNTLLRRMLNPGSRLEYPTRTVIEKVGPGNWQVREGDDVTITAVCLGEIPQKGELHVRTEGGSWETMPLLRQGRDSFAYTFSDVHQSFDYYLALGDDESEAYRITVVAGPKVIERRITLKFPPHTNLPTRENESYYIEAPEGTEITWRLTLDKPVREAYVVKAPVGGGKMTVSADGMTVEGSLPAWEPFEYYFRWRLAAPDFVYHTPGRYTVNVIPDASPRVDVLHPPQDTIATVRKRFSVEFRANDDYGLTQAWLIYSVNGGAEQTWDLGPLSGQSVRETRTRKLADLVPGLKENDKIVYHVRVADNRVGKEGRNLAESRKRRIDVLSIPDYLRAMYEESTRWTTEVEALHGEETEAAEQVETMKPPGTAPATRPSNP